VAASACKSTGNDEKEPVMLDGEDVAPLQVPEQQDMTKVPMALWSPTQRQSTAGYYYMVAEYVALKERDPKKSLALFEAAYGLDPNPFLGGKMLAAKAVAGDRGEALLEARKMVLLYPRDPNLRFFYGEMLSQNGDFDEASAQLEKCVDLDPQMENAYLSLIQVYQAQKQVPKALVDAKDMVKHLPGSIMGWSVLSRIYLTMNQPKDALVPARRAYEMQSSNPHLTQIYAIVLQLNGRTKQAISIYEQLYRMDPTDEELTSRMVDLYREIGNLESAVDLLDEMAKSGGQRRPVVQMQKAILLWELKRNKEAVDLLEALVKEYPESDKVKYLAAFANERMERLDRALELYRAVPKTSPTRREADVRSLLILKNQKKMDEALALASDVLQGDPTWEHYGIVAGVYSDAGRQEDAIRTTEQGYAKFPDKTRLLVLRGVYEEKAGELKECIKTMRDVIAKDPDNSSAYNFLGYIYAERGENLDEAEKLVKRALELKPDDGFYMDSLGWVYYQKGDYDKALPVLEKAAKLEPKEGVIFEHIADVKLKKGDKGAARDNFKKALATELEDKDKARIEKKLADLGAG
jgi:tetratricopeptide (TPR) repeat protein